MVQTQYAPLATIAPIVKDPFVLALQDIPEMLFLIVSGVNVKATANVLIIRRVSITNVLIPAAVNVEQVHNARQKDIWLFAHAQLALMEMRWCPAERRRAIR